MMVAWPAAVTDHLLCSFSTLVAFSKQFPLQRPHTHMETSRLPVFFFNQSCCTMLIAFKGKTACMSKGRDESGLMIYNTWAPSIGAEQKV